MTPLNPILLALGAVLLVLSLAVPPAGASFYSRVPAPPASQRLSSPVYPGSPVPGGVSLSLPSSMVREGYPSVVTMTAPYFGSHWKDTESQAAEGLLYDYASSVAVTPAMARAGWVLGAPESQQPVEAALASGSVPRAGPLDYAFVGATVYLLPVPKMLSAFLGAAALALGLVVSGSARDGEVSVRRGGPPR